MLVNGNFLNEDKCMILPHRSTEPPITGYRSVVSIETLFSQRVLKQECIHYAI